MESGKLKTIDIKPWKPMQPKHWMQLPTLTCSLNYQGTIISCQIELQVGFKLTTSQ